MTIEKLEYTRTDGSYSPSSSAVIGKLNEIIDHLNSKEVFPDTGKKVESNRGADLTPVPPVTSTIEEQINQIENIIRNWGLAAGADILTVKWEKWLKQLLSSLSPIQKKRSEDEITEYCKKKCYWLQDLCAISQFMQDHNLLQE